MKASELLHYAFRAHDPHALGRWYAGLFEGTYLLHPVMSALDIVIVKLNHPEALFDGLLEFWPWDIVWDGSARAFRRIEPRRSPTSYGHLALKIALDAPAIVAELERRGVPFRMEPRANGFEIPVVDDPEGNMVELFPNVDNLPLPPEALCSIESINQVLPELKARFEQRMAELDPADGYPLLMFEQS